MPTEQLRAEPIQPEEKKYEAPDLTPDKKKVRELAGGERLDKGNDESVLKYNKAWAEMYQEKGVDHPLVKKILEFQGEGDAKKAVDAIKEMQKDLGVEADGVIGEQTLRKYHERLEKNEREGIRSESPEGNNQSPFDASVETFSTIDQLGTEEKQEKLKTHAEKLAQAETNTVTQDINGKTIQVAEEDGEKVFRGTEENSDKYYNPESGEYETKEARTDRIKTQDAEKASKRTERLGELKKIGEEGATYGTDFEGQSIVYSAKKKVWEATGGENAGKTLNLETGKFELTTEQVKKHGEEFATKLRSGTEEELKDLKDVHGNPLTVTEQDDKRVALGTGDNEGKIYQPETGTYEFTTEEIKKQGEEFATKLRSGKEEELKDMKDVHGNPVKITEQDDKRVALGTGENEGKIYQPETGTYEATKEEQETTKEQQAYEDQRKRAGELTPDILKIEAASGGFFDLYDAIGDIELSRAEDQINGSRGNKLTNEQRELVHELAAQAKEAGMPDDVTIGEYVTMMRDPSKAAERFVKVGDEAKSLPGRLGEYGVKYKRTSEQGPILAYREDSEVPKILQDGREVDIQEYFGDRVLESISLGGGKEIMFTKNEGGKKEYALIEKQEGKVIATRKIKEDGTLFEQQSEAPTSVASI